MILNPLTVNTKQAMEILNIPRGTLYALVKKGVLTPLKTLRRNKLFRYQDLVDFADQNSKVQAAPNK